ncbi:MAG: YIP1 family protein [Myxococcales bacterium]|nr:YIP1 family protein [Myxococcales bacterium]
MQTLSPADDHRHGFVTRVGRVLRLDPAVFSEIEADRFALPQAAAIVVVAGFSRGLLGLGFPGPGLAGSVAGGLVLWVVTTALLTVVGVRWVHGTTDFSEMLRTLGFAAVPLWFLAPISWIPSTATQQVLTFIVQVWALTAGVVAVRQALNVDTPRALLVWLLAVSLTIGLLLLLSTHR